MIDTILVDDEIHCLDTLSILLEDYCPEVRVLDRCTSAKAALRSIEQRAPALIFLDIEMPSMNGFEFLELFSEIPFAVIFTTSYDQYAIKAFHFSALDYLLKPINPKELINAVRKVELHKRPLQEQFQMLLGQLQQRGSNFTKMAVPTADGYELIPVDEIVRCEADNNYTHLYLKNRNKITVCRSLRDVETQLHDYPFFLRVHHSHIVNLNEVTQYVRGDGGYLVMSNGSTVSVSRTRKESLLKWF